MAKRAPVGETPYRPLLDIATLNAALAPAAQTPDPQKKIVTFSARPV